MKLVSLVVLCSFLHPAQLHAAHVCLFHQVRLLLLLLFLCYSCSPPLLLYLQFIWVAAKWCNSHNIFFAVKQCNENIQIWLVVLFLLIQQNEKAKHCLVSRNTIASSFSNAVRKLNTNTKMNMILRSTSVKMAAYIQIASLYTSTAISQRSQQPDSECENDPESDGLRFSLPFLFLQVGFRIQPCRHSRHCILLHSQVSHFG